MNQACAAVLKRQIVGADLDLERRTISPPMRPQPGVQLLRIARQAMIEPRQVAVSVDVSNGQGEKLLWRIAVLRHRRGVDREKQMGPAVRN